MVWWGQSRSRPMRPNWCDLLPKWYYWKRRYQRVVLNDRFLCSVKGTVLPKVLFVLRVFCEHFFFCAFLRKKKIYSLFLSIFYISQRLTLWYFVFLYLIFLSQQVLYFLLSTLVLTLYIDVVLSLSIWIYYIFNGGSVICGHQFYILWFLYHSKTR